MNTGINSSGQIRMAATKFICSLLEVYRLSNHFSIMTKLEQFFSHVFPLYRFLYQKKSHDTGIYDLHNLFFLIYNVWYTWVDSQQKQLQLLTTFRYDSLSSTPIIMGYACVKTPIYTFVSSFPFCNFNRFCDL